MIHGCDNVEFEFAVRGCLENARINLDLLNAGTVELAEGGDNAGFLAGTGWSVDEEVGEVAALGL